MIFPQNGGENKFGGNIGIYNFGIRQLSQKRESTAILPLIYFSPVLREYSQRIIATTTLQIEVLRTPTLTSFITTTIPVMTVTNIIGNFVSLTTFMTAAGLTLTTAMTTMMTMESRMANVEVTVHRSNGIILTTFGRSRILATLPPATAPRPYVLTITIQPLVVIFSDAIVIISPLPQFPVGALLAFPPSGGGTFTITIVQGSEEFISITTMVSTTTEMQTSPPIITETRMTNAATPTTMEVITPERMITTAMTAFVILVSVIIGGLVCISVVVDTIVVMLINSSLPCTMVIVKVPPPDGGNAKRAPTGNCGRGLIITIASEKITTNGWIVIVST